MRLCLLGFQLHYCNSFLLETDQYSFCFDFSYICLSQDIMTLFLYKYIFTGRKRSHLQFHLFKIQWKQSVPTCCGRWGYWPLLSHDHGFDFKCRMQWWWMDADHEAWWQSGSWLTLSMVAFSFQFLILNVSQFPFLCKITFSTLVIYKNKLIAETHLLSLQSS